MGATSEELVCRAEGFCSNIPRDPQQGFIWLLAPREASETLWPCHIWSHVTPSPAWTISLCGESRVAFVGSQLSLPFYSHGEGIA